MPFDIYDYRTDIRNVVITPEIRSRFMRMEPGTVAPGHTHDIGQEVWIVMEGQAEFEIDGERAIVGPNQMVFARADQMHEVRVVGDQPMTMYLSVSPHLEPTHTRWDDQGNKQPPSYGGSTQAERAAQGPPTESLHELADRHIAASKALAEAAVANAREQEAAAAALKQAAEAGDSAAAKAAVDAMWSQIYPTYKRFQAMELAWNELAPRASE